MNRRRQRNILNIVVIVMFLVLSGLVISQSFTQSARQPTTAPISAPVTNPVSNPIVEENNKPGTDKWQSPNHNDYLKQMADEQKKRMEGTPSASDR
jgi:hypothetical protein